MEIFKIPKKESLRTHTSLLILVYHPWRFLKKSGHQDISPIIYKSLTGKDFEKNKITIIIVSLE